MNLLEAFEKQAVNGISRAPDKIIETLISKLFFFDDKVYKVYKWNKAFFGDFSSLDFRKDFYKEDFFWNNAMAPQIYVALKTVRFNQNSFEDADIQNAEDLYIEMNKINDEDSLTKKLIDKKITEDDLRLITREITTRLAELTRDRINTLQDVVDRGLVDLKEEIIRDLREWCYMADPQFPKERTDEILTNFSQAFKKEKYFYNFKKASLSISIDSHSDNVIYTAGKVGFIDILPPKEMWRIDDPFYNVCRLATDVAALNSRDLANVMYDEYSKMMPLGPENVKNIYELDAALIKGPYLSVLKRNVEAEKYFVFINETTKKLV